MLNNEKIGIAIVTYNRTHLLETLYSSLPLEKIDNIIIVNDGSYFESIVIPNEIIIHNNSNIGVGASKNKALRYLIDSDVDHFFVFEDDVYVKNSNFIEAYISASKSTGIQHFNFGLHKRINYKKNNKKNFKYQLSYNEANLVTYSACFAAMSYYSKKCIVETGLMDEGFYNALEHLEHTFRCGLDFNHTPYWDFVDLADSDFYIEDIEIEYKSAISNNENHNNIIDTANKYFFVKYGYEIDQIKATDFLDFLFHLNQIYKRIKNEELNESFYYKFVNNNYKIIENEVLKNMRQKKYEKFKEKKLFISSRINSLKKIRFNFLLCVSYLLGRLR